jgi:SAM-dependent methyltransferase
MNLSSLLCCVSITPTGARCIGMLREVESQRDRLQCIRCHAEYTITEGVPVMRTDATAEICNALDGIVYARKSRHDSLAGKDLYLSQSLGMISYLDRMTAKGLVRGPSLEIGCGVGIFADRAPDYVGLDYSLAALLADGFEGYARVCASGDLLPFRNAVFKTLFSLNTLEHVPELERCFQELDRVLMPGGVLILKPAWNCMQYNCDGVGYFPYSALTFRNKAIKALLPLIRSQPYKALTRIPWRIFHQLIHAESPTLNWKRLRPRFDLLFKVADAEAFSQIDISECIRWFAARGYRCISHPTIRKRLCAGHDFVCLVKPDP